MNSKRKSHLRRYIITCFVCLFMTACDTEEPFTPVTKSQEIKTESTKPVLDLSLDNISIEQKFDDDTTLEEKNSELFEKLNQKKTGAEISVSGKLLTDDNKDEDYLKTVEGAEIIIKGRFD